MNKTRREALSKLTDKIDGIRGEVEELLNEEQDYFDAMPESLQGSDKGQAAEEAIGYLEEAISALEEVAAQLSSASGT